MLKFGAPLQYMALLKKKKKEKALMETAVV